MRIQTAYLVGALALSGAVTMGAPMKIHVSPNGKDTNPGTAAKPFATIVRARDEVRALKKSEGLPKDGVVIELGDGIYELPAPFELAAEDSGAESAPVVYKAATRGATTLSGGVALANWQPVTDRAVANLIDAKAEGKIVWTELPADLIETIPGFANGGCGYKGKRDYPLALYQDNKRLSVSRWPNEGFVLTGECLGESVDWGRGIKFTEGVFRFDDARLKRWVEEPDLWFDGLWYWHWADQKMKCKAIDLKEKTIALCDPESHSFGFKTGQDFYAFNAIGEIDQPGEWAVDRATRRIYLWPAADPKTSPVTVAIRPNLVVARGIEHVRFEDIVFENTLKTAVVITDSKFVTISGSTFRHTGSWGVDINGGNDCTVIGCDLYDLGEGGAQARGGDQKTLTPGNHLIENNHIHHFGRFVNTYRPAASVNGVGNTIRHNLIHHAQHQAISFGGNNHLIEYNVIHDVCLHTSDAGAIYACARDWSLRGAVIRHNFIHATGKGVDACGSQGIYMDDYTSGLTIVGNICSSVGHAVTTCGNGNLIENNLGINCRKYTFSISSRGADSFAKNNALRGMESPLITKLLRKDRLYYTSDAWKARYPHLGQLLDMIQTDPIGAHDSHFCTMRNNVNVGGIPAHVSNAKKVMTTCTVENNINIYDDPGFVDMGGFDLRLRKDSRIFKKLPEFKPLEFEKMGLYADARRASPAVKFGEGISPMSEIQPRIPRPELKPRYILEILKEKPFEADGVADSKEWPNSRKPELECINEIYKEPSKYMCKARIGFDGARIRFLITVDIDPEQPLKLDGKWGGRDGLELAFSDIDEDAPVFLLHGYPDGTFEVVPEGADATATAEALQKAMAYGAKMDKGAWTAEIAIPLAELGIAPETFEQLRFNMNLHRTCDKTWTCWWTPENGIANLLSSGLLHMPREMPETPEMIRRREAAAPLFDAFDKGELTYSILKDWSETADPDGLGPAAQPAGAPVISFSEYAGWAVARRTFKLSAEQLAEPFCALFLPCIDEEGDVYIDGKLILSHTAKATGTAPGLLWREPVIVDLKVAGVEPGDLKAAVHLRGNMGTGGLRKGAFLVWGKTVPTAEQLYDFFAENPKLGWRDRVPAFWKDLTRERIPELPSVPDEAQFGKRIQRTMRLLASSTPEKRNHVRIFFYGQSITQGMHSREMINVLRTRYPWAIIDFENKAIGGFGASSLVRTGEHDLYPRDADLLIFHVYGDAKSLDTIFSNVRKRNSSEILVYTHHYNWDNSPEKIENRLSSHARSVAEWHELAEKYQMELAPVFRDWPLFFRKHDWGINEVMGDTVHPNVHHNVQGHVLLANLVLRNFRLHPDAPLTFPDAVTSVDLKGPAVTTTGAWTSDGCGLRTSAKDAGLKLSFDGNRIDILPLPSANPGTARILIDGKAPGELHELYYCSLPSQGPYIWMPAIKRVDLGENILPRTEDWTLTPFDVDLEKRTLRYKLEGSMTGPDGEGDKTADFVSNSGRIELAPEDFNICWPCSYKKKDKLPEGYTVTWQIRPLFADPWQPFANADPAYGRPVTLVKGLANGPHTLEIIANGDGTVPIHALIVRKPPLYN